MKALAEGRIPGVSWAHRMLLLGQSIMTGTALDNTSGQDDGPHTVLDHVIKSDARRERALRHAKSAWRTPLHILPYMY